MEEKQMLLDLDAKWVESDCPDLRSAYREGKKYPDINSDEQESWDDGWVGMKKVCEDLSWHVPTDHDRLCEKLDKIIEPLTAIQPKQIEC